MFGKPKPLPAGPDQESVWDYPRPPRLEPVTRRLRVVFSAVTIADTTRGFRVLETSHPPTYYLPPDDIVMAHLRPSEGRGSACEWKGAATYYDVLVGDRVAERAAWSYPSPPATYLPLKDHVAFYAQLLDGCYVDGERVTPQPGAFYGGWITEDLVGPFKGERGSGGW